MATDDEYWSPYQEIRKLDRKLNYVKNAKDWCKEKAKEGAHILGICLALSIPGGLLLGGTLELANYLASKQQPAPYQTTLNASRIVKDEYDGLAEKVSERTGVDKNILLGLIAGGQTSFANDLREQGYTGIIPIRPREVGITAETLVQDEEQCLMSAAKVFNDVCQAHKTDDLEAAVALFWNRENEPTERGEWGYVDGARHAFEKRTNTDYYFNRKSALDGHKAALALEKHLKERKDLTEDEIEFEMRMHGETLMKKITSPSYMAHCKATVEAYELWNAGNKDFTWIDLLQPKLAAVTCCSLAHMNGVVISSKSKKDE